MAVYRERVLPHIVNKVMDNATIRPIRARVCAGLSGDVLEIGFGTGHNLPFLSSGVTRLRAVEPSGVSVRLAEQRIAAAPFPVEVVGLDGQRLPLDDHSVDQVLCTFSLCTIPDPVAAVREMRRVLRPGGQLRFAEHGAAPEPGVERWQRRLTPVQRRLGGGCHLDRDIAAILERGGMRVVDLDRYYAPGQPKPFASMYEGSAVPA